MNAPTHAAVHIRSYEQPGAPDRHDFAQLVLPLSGALLLDVDGRTGMLDPLHGAVVAPGAWHAQGGAAHNRSLVVDFDLDPAGADPAHGARLLERPFVPVGAAARKLVEFMGILAAHGAPAPGLLTAWLPLLLDTLVLEAPRPASRLAALLARIEAEPGLPWTVESMAASAHLSVSRLHALFRERMDASPHGWLLALRMTRVRDWLAHTDLPIAELALRAGFSDQSALTRAMRRVGGVTPAEFRRRARQEIRPRARQV